MCIFQLFNSVQRHLSVSHFNDCIKTNASTRISLIQCGSLKNRKHKKRHSYNHPPPVFYIQIINYIPSPALHLAMFIRFYVGSRHMCDCTAYDYDYDSTHGIIINFEKQTKIAYLSLAERWCWDASLYVCICMSVWLCHLSVYSTASNNIWI